MSTFVISPGDLCHPTLVREPFSRDGWCFQLKHDGFRCMVVKMGRDVRVLSRHGRSLSESFPDVVRAFAPLPFDIVVDGELIVPDAAGRSAFHRLQRRALLRRAVAVSHAAAAEPAVVVAFDVLLGDGRDMRSAPLSARQAWLADNLRGYPGVQVIQSIEGQGAALYAVACEQDHEGIVGKQLDAPYRAGRQRCWIKIKNSRFSRPAALGWRT